MKVVNPWMPSLCLAVLSAPVAHAELYSGTPPWCAEYKEVSGGFLSADDPLDEDRLSRLAQQTCRSARQNRKDSTYEKLFTKWMKMTGLTCNEVVESMAIRVDTARPSRPSSRPSTCPSLLP